MGANAGTAKQQAVIDLARLLGWRVATFRAVRTPKGWRTPVGGDGKGFPDLLMIRGDRIKVREVKSGEGETSAEQDEWIEAFRSAGVDAGVWHAEDLNTSILEELR